MFGTIGGPELLLIFVVALLIFGPRKLSEIGRSLGKAVGEFRRAASDLRDTLDAEVAKADASDRHRNERIGEGGGAGRTAGGSATEAGEPVVEEAPKRALPAGSEPRGASSRPGVPASGAPEIDRPAAAGSDAQERPDVG